MKNTVIFVIGMLIGAVISNELSLVYVSKMENSVSKMEHTVSQMECSFAANRQTTEEAILVLLTQHMDTWSMIRPEPHWLEFAEQFGHAVAEGDYYDSYE